MIDKLHPDLAPARQRSVYITSSFVVWIRLLQDDKNPHFSNIVSFHHLHSIHLSLTLFELLSL
jgi:hypothetical protein